MKKLNLCLHAGSHKVEFAELANIPLPDRTDTYVPVPHQTLFGMVRDNMSAFGLSVVDEIHAINRKGAHYFAMMHVAPAGMDSEIHGFIVGLRNSLDKSLAAAMVGGQMCFVCDNLAFSGEYSLSRKHTVNVFADLPPLIVATLQQLPSLWTAHNARVQKYMEIQMSDFMAHDTIANLWRNGTLLKTEIAGAIDQWHSPLHEEFAGRTLWSLYNAVTEAWKGGRLDTLSDRSASLHRTLDAFLTA